MDQKWKIVYYETSQGKSPIFDFISTLELKARTKVSYLLDLLKEFGTHLSLPYARKITRTDLWELRVLGSNNIRIFYVAVVDKKFLLLHGFQKKKQKTDRKEIKIAKERLKEFEMQQNGSL